MLQTVPEIDSRKELDTPPAFLLVRFPDGTSTCLQLPDVKSTIGSGAGCTIPIQYPGVSPLHCVLFPSAAGWRIRRWSAGTKLNGEPFAESPVDCGDRLQLGPVELEFVAEPLAAHPGEDSPRGSGVVVRERNGAEAETRPNVETFRSSIDEELAEQKNDLAQLREQFEAVAGRLEDASGQFRDRMHALSERLSHAEQFQESALGQLSEQNRQLEELRTQLSAGPVEFQALEAARCELNDRLAALQQEFANSERQRAATSEALAEQRRQLESIGVRFAEIPSWKEEFDTALSDFRQQLGECHHTFALANQRESSLAEAIGDLDRRMELLCTRLDANLDRIDELQRHRTELIDWQLAVDDKLARIEGLHGSSLDTLADHRRELDQLRNQVHDIPDRLRELDTARCECHNQRSAIDGRLVQIEQLCHSTAEALKMENCRVDAIRDRIEATACHNPEWEAALGGLQGQLQLLQDELFHATTSQASNAKELTEQHRQLGELCRTVAGQAALEDWAKTAVSEVQERLAGLPHELRDHFVAADELAKATGRFEALQTAVADWPTWQVRTEAALAELRSHFDEVRLEVASNHPYHDSISATLEEFSRRLVELESQQSDGLTREASSAGEVNELREQVRQLRLDLDRAEQLYVATREEVAEWSRQIAGRPPAPGGDIGRSDEDAYRADPVGNAWEEHIELAPEPGIEAPSNDEPGTSNREPYREPDSFLSKYQHLLSSDDDTATETDDRPAANSSGAFASQSALDSVPDMGVEKHGEEDSIEDYMSRLLQRVRGKPNANTSGASAKATKAASEPNVAAKPVSAVQLVSDLEEIRAAPAPERSRDMNSLRHLANESARQSLQQSRVRKSREYAVVKLFVSVFAIICGYVVMGLAPSFTSPEFIGGLVPVIAGLIWGGKTILIILQAMRAGSFDNLDHTDERPSDIPVELSADEL